MPIQAHTDDSVEDREALAAQVETAIQGTFKRFGERLTRVRCA